MTAIINKKKYIYIYIQSIKKEDRILKRIRKEVVVDRETKAKGKRERERGAQKGARQRGVRFARRETAGKISQGTVSPAVKIRV